MLREGHDLVGNSEARHCAFVSATSHMQAPHTVLTDIVHLAFEITPVRALRTVLVNLPLERVVQLSGNELAVVSTGKLSLGAGVTHISDIDGVAADPGLDESLTVAPVRLCVPIWLLAVGVDDASEAEGQRSEESELHDGRLFLWLDWSSISLLKPKSSV